MLAECVYREVLQWVCQHGCPWQRGTHGNQRFVASERCDGV